MAGLIGQECRGIQAAAVEAADQVGIGGAVIRMEDDRKFPAIAAAADLCIRSGKRFLPSTTLLLTVAMRRCGKR